MKSEFTFTETFEKFFSGFKVWISPYTVPDLPVLDLNMDITVSCSIAACLTADETDPVNWKSAPVTVNGKIIARRVVIGPHGQSHMVYTIDPTHESSEDIRHHIDSIIPFPEN